MHPRRRFLLACAAGASSSTEGTGKSISVCITGDYDMYIYDANWNWVNEGKSTPDSNTYVTLTSGQEYTFTPGEGCFPTRFYYLCTPYEFTYLPTTDAGKNTEITTWLPDAAIAVGFDDGDAHQAGAVQIIDDYGNYISYTITSVDGTESYTANGNDYLFLTVGQTYKATDDTWNALAWIETMDSSKSTIAIDDDASGGFTFTVTEDTVYVFMGIAGG